MLKSIRILGAVVMCGLWGVPQIFAANPSGDLRIEVLSAYNLVVDSNVESPSTYAPRSAYLSAKIYNDGANDMTNVFAYIGNYTDGTAGIYPSRAHPPLVGPLPGSEFALTHEGGSSGIADATRFIGTIPAGEYVAVYWLISYPNLDENGDAVWGPSVKPDDDLWLNYDIWSDAMDAGVSLTANETRKVTMRNEISASANKIYPNGANKVPDAYKALLDRYQPAWTNIYSDGSPGTPIWTEGIWYDLGNVGQGFDNDGDLIPDKNAWMQPVGDPSVFDPSAFRLVRTYAMVVVKLKGGGEQVYMVDDQLYFENIPENNGAVGLVRYEFMALKSGVSGTLSPYQEVASGFDNEKFSGDYGAVLGDSLVTAEPHAQIDKTGDLVEVPGGVIDYQLAYTNSGALDLGNPEAGLGIVIRDSVPEGTRYVPGSAAISNTLPAGVTSYAVNYSTNNALTWTTTEPAAATNVTDLQWWLSDVFDAGTAGIVTFQVTVDIPYTNVLPMVENNAGITIGGSDPFDEDSVVTLIEGTNQVGDTVFADDGSGAGTLADGIQNGSESGISNVTVLLYFDGNANGVIDADDVLLSTGVSDGTGQYLFDALPDGNYLVQVDADDSDLPYGYAQSTDMIYGVDLDSGNTNGTTQSYLDADFGFAPILAFSKQIDTAGPFREADTISYSISVANNVAGSGGYGSHDVWATTYDAANSGTGNKAWLNPENAYSPAYPDGVTAKAELANAGEKMAVNGYSITAQDGDITKVEMVIPMIATPVLDVSDDLDITLLENSVSIWTTNLALSALSTQDLTYDITSLRSWSWDSFAATNLLSIQLLVNGGPKTTGSLEIDQAGFRLTTDWVSGSSDPAITLNPVPVYDTYDTNRLEFVSASIPPDSVSYSGDNATLAWSNLGPLYPGNASTVTVNYIVLEPPSNTAAAFTNTAYVTGATYADGNPVNSITNTVITNALPAGSIGDYVWRDLNGDGVQDGGNETGIEGVSVVLTPPGGVDVGNGAGNPVTNVTDSSGYYLFEGLPADGDYTVAVVTATLPGGSGTNTYDEDDGTNSPNHQTVHTLVHDATDGSDTHLTADFGYQVDSVINGTIWDDVNISGTSSPDDNEPWLTGVTVRLYAGTGTNGTLVATTTNDANGFFEFTGAGVSNGTYTIVTLPTTGDMATGNWTQSYDTSTPAVNEVTISLVSGGTARGDFSYYQTGSYVIGDTLFYDWDGDQTQDAIDEGIADTTVTLYRDNDGDGVLNLAIDTLVGTNVTDDTGTYSFTGLYATNYIVVVDQNDEDFPQRYVVTADPQGINDGVSAVTLTATDLTQDFGYTPYGNGSIGDTVFQDLNADGSQLGSREVGVSNILVTLKVDLDGDGTYVTLATTNTAADGSYLFENLPEGTYQVVVDTADADLPDDRFGVGYIATTSATHTYALDVDEAYLAADFGFGPLGAIGDTIFWDANRSGGQDYNEDGIEGVVVHLYNDLNGDGFYDGGDTLYETETTDASGNYLFSGLPAGDYVVVVQHSGVIAGADLMSDPNADGIPCDDPSVTNILGGCDGEYGTSIGAGSAFMGADFGYVPDGVIGDAVWLDTNNNGVYDADEVGIPYIPVILYSNGVAIATNETDSSGYYLFQALDDGTYTVVIDNTHSNFPSGLGATYDFDGTNTPHTITNIVLTSGAISSVNGVSTNDVDLDMDFGYRYAGGNTLSGTIGLDDPTTNGVMGVSDSGVETNEVPFANVPVFIYYWADDGDGIQESGEVRFLGSTTTTNNGDYAFTGLPEGDSNSLYLVSLTAPEANLQLTTETGDTPANSVTNNTDSFGSTISAYQVVTPAAAVTNIDFAFVSSILYDFGDLPQSYATLREGVPVGAGHIVETVPDLYLGSSVDTEMNGQPSAGADGDGLDEDGISALGLWYAGGDSEIGVTIGAGAGWLVGFIDFNNDGDLSDYGEMMISQQVSASGAANFTNTFSIPSGTMSETNVTQLYARFRLFDSEPGFPAFAFSGLADAGEVEDYRWDFGALGDYVWKDTDADGIQDPGEPPIDGVRLFVDENGDGIYQTNEYSTVTDTNGFYGLGGFSAGTYSLNVDTSTLPAYAYATYDLDGTGTLHDATVVMTNGQLRADVDFGYAPMGVGGYVWLDDNTNGIQDEVGIEGVSNVVVRLYDATTNLISSTTTAPNGTYFFDVGTPGDYFVEFFPSVYLVSPQDQGGDDTLDSDGATNLPYRTALTTLSAGERDTELDLGLYLPVQNNVVGDFVWFDYDRDGIQDVDEEGVAGVTVKLYTTNGTFVTQTTTDDAGNYHFAGLDPNDYRVLFEPPSGFFISPADQTGDAADSDADVSTGYTPGFTVTTNAEYNTWDAGMYAVADLSVTKVVNDTEPSSGTNIWFDIVVSNAGPSTATEVEYTDTWPPGLTFVAAVPEQGTYTASNGLWTIGTIAAGDTVSLVVTGSVPVSSPGMMFTNVITLTDLYEPDTNAANNSATSSVLVVGTDVGIIKVVDDPTPYEGSNVTYTLTVTNLGQKVATGVLVYEPLASGVTYVSHSAGQGTYTSSNGVWAVGTIAISNTASMTITASVDAGVGGTSVTNTSAVTYVDQGDPNPSNDTDTAVITVPGADLGVTKSVDNLHPNEDETVVYTIVVTNNGPAATTSVTLSEPLHADLTYVTNTVSAGSYNSGSGIWTIGAMTVGESQTMTITCTINNGTKFGYIPNTATITGSGLPDPNPDNDSDTVTLGISDLELLKSSDATGFVPPGSNIWYTIAVTNVGHPPHTGLDIADPLPSGVTYVADSAQVTRPFSTNVYALDNFDAIAYTNNDGDVDWGSDWTEVGTAADVNVAADGTNVNVLAIEKSGNGVERDVAFSNVVAATLSFDYRRVALDSSSEFIAVSVSTNGGGEWIEVGRVDGSANDATYQSYSPIDITDYITTNTSIQFLTTGNGNNEFFYLDNIRVDMEARVYRTVAGSAPSALVSGLHLYEEEYVQVIYAATVDNPPTAYSITNIAAVSSDLQPFAKYASVTDAVEYLDLAIYKTVNDFEDGDVQSGTNELVSYTIVLTNNGPADASNVSISESWPSEVSYSNSWVSVGTYDTANATNHIWTIPALSAGSAATLVITGRISVVERYSFISNTVAITAVDQYEENMLNNTDRVTVATLAVIADVTGYAVNGRAMVEWTTLSEIGTAGFVLQRLDGGRGFVNVTDQIVPACHGSVAGGVYRLWDDGASLSGGTYRLIELEFGGNRLMHGPYEVTFASWKAGAPLLSTKDVSSSVSRQPEPAAFGLASKDAGPDLRLPLDEHLTTGEWRAVKLFTRGEGIRSVTATTVADLLGLPLVDVTQAFAVGDVSIWNQGILVPHAIRNAGEALLFAAEEESTIYSDENVYFLAWIAGVVMPMSNAAPASAGALSVVRELLQEEQDLIPVVSVPWESPDADYWWWNYASSVAGYNTLSYSFDLPDVVTNEPAQLEVELLGVMEASDAQIVLGGQVLGSTNWNYTGRCQIRADIPAGLLAAESNALEVVISVKSWPDYSLVYLGGFSVEFARDSIPKENRLLLTAAATETMTIGPFSTNDLVLFDTTVASAPIQVTGLLTGGVGATMLSFDAVAGHRYAIVAVDTIVPVERLEQDVPSDLYAAENRGRYLVITVPGLEVDAQRLAAYRTSKGLSTSVVFVNDIFDEFSAGLPYPWAIREFLRYAVNQWAEAPEFVVLAGEGTMDYRGLQGGQDNLVLPWMVSTPEGIFCGDNQYADFDSNNIPELAIGRLPAGTVAQMDDLVSKIIRYESQPQAGWQGRLYSVNDIPDRGGDFHSSGQHLRNQVAGRYTTDSLDLAAGMIETQLSTLEQTFGEGLVFLNYYGHGAIADMSSDKFLSITNVPTLPVSDQVPVLTAMSCVLGQFSNPDTDCLGEALVLRPDGGAIAAWAPSGMSHHKFGESLARHFYADVTSGNLVLGHSVRKSLVAFAKERNVPYLPAIYNLLGDPALIIGGVASVSDPYGNEAMSFGSWRSQMFSEWERLDAELSSDGADPDGDQLDNFAEYALGQDAFEGSGRPFIELSRLDPNTNDVVRFSFPRRRGVRDVEFHVDLSADLQGWLSGSSQIQSVDVDDSGSGDTETVHMTIDNPFVDDNKLFIRLGVSRLAGD